MFLLDYFQYFYLLELFALVYLFILNGLKVKNYLKINILSIKNYESNYKMDMESLQIKNKYHYLWNDTIYIYDFDIDLVKIFKRESKIGVNIYYIGYKPGYDDTITPLDLVINRLFGFIEGFIEGSSDRYLVVSINNEIIINIFNKLWKYIENKIISDDSINKIKEYYKLRFDSDLYLPTKTLIEFHTLTININCVIEKDGKYYPEIYLDECFYVKDNL